MEKHIENYIKSKEYRAWSALNILQYLSDYIKFTNDSVEEIFRIFKQQLVLKSQDPNVFKHARDKAEKLAESLNIDEEVKNFLSDKDKMVSCISLLLMLTKI